MIFSSYEFLVFLALVVTVWLALERRGLLAARKVFLIGASLVFYAWWRLDAVVLLLGSIAANYMIGTHLQREGVNRRLWGAIGVGLNLGVLALFKYLGLFDATAEALLGVQISLPTLFLPLAISFFTFQQISWIVDAARGTAPRYSASDYLLFIAFFPHLIAGPIVLHHELIPQFLKTRTAEEQGADLAAGLTLFTIGLFKKGLIADVAGPYADVVFNAAAGGAPLGFADAWLGSAFFGMQIYFDFSAYSDMALGAALMLGIRLPMNFNSPYKAASIGDFWRRWHISLSNFLRDYLYIPLGGNRRGPGLRYLNLMLTMLIGGLWHGASWTFVAWGGLHGAFLVANHLWDAAAARMGWRTPAPLRLLALALGVALTFAATTMAWTFFRAPTFPVAWQAAGAMLGLGGAESAILAADRSAWALLAVLLAIVWLAPNAMQVMRFARPALHLPDWPGARLAWRPTAAAAVLFGALFLISGLAISSLRPFLYFQF